MRKAPVSETRVRSGGGTQRSRPATGRRRGPRIDLTRIPPGWAAGALLVAAALILAVWILSMSAGETETLPTAATPGPTPVVSPTVAPPAPPRVQVGGWVRVRGTEGGDLRLRATPGLSGETLAFVQEGSLLRVLEGPVEADGYTWWRVQAPEDQTGWAAGQWLAPE